ncbi:hypothetical protein C3E79_05065 [Corynebacterium liangguodongii]|uniref:Uncharacterized protein n=2 Tax=Corynebacterium liangguodongii TaxID=2079535 RepID=A0A2S0WGZ8_9CORY|nr:hypothetical protein C3E79_05065 [Corynebacterium liangguodongii]PWB99105.1 hypothetical protein DF219_08715 [Corynebacterium liangguodongii]
MRSAHEWLSRVVELLKLPAGVERSSVGPILDLTKDVAHNRSRPAAPVTAFLVGLAAGRAASGSDDELNAAISRAVEAVRAAASTRQNASY